MGLVDYDSSSSSSSPSNSDAEQTHRDRPPRVKRRKTSSTTNPSSSQLNDTISSHTLRNNNSSNKENTTPLPPLPSTFHNLYASTVRPAAADLPSLHQGRRRLIPHVAGNWPSHLYIEWHPPPAAHEALTALLAALVPVVSDANDATTNTTTGPTPKLTSFLTSDLGAPLPLHVSLSRPFVLRTAEKDRFLDDLVQALALRSSCPLRATTGTTTSATTAPFELRVDDLAWFRSPEAERSFLVLRVRSSSAVVSSSSPSSSSGTLIERPRAARTRAGTAATATATAMAAAANAQTQDKDGVGTHSQTQGPSRNPELMALLSKCNDVVGEYGQPKLYARSGGVEPANQVEKENGTTRSPQRTNHLDDERENSIGQDGYQSKGPGNTQTSISINGTDDGVQDTTTTAATSNTTTEQAFHISIAWSFITPTDELRAQTAAVFSRPEFQTSIRDSIRIPVKSVKAKIGNVVTDIPLSGAANRGAVEESAGRSRRRGLFGI